MMSMDIKNIKQGTGEIENSKVDINNLCFYDVKPVF